MELNQFRDVDLVIDKANDNFVQRQFVSQGDYKGRTLTVQVTDNGLIGQVPGLMLNLRWHNQASGLADLSAFECIDAENSVFRIEYPEHMMTPGKVIANIQVIQDGKVTHLKSFELTVQNLVGEMTGIVEKAEFGALVAVLADANKFRTDIDSLGMDKADKEEVNLLVTYKADKTALATTNATVEGLASNKVDKGGNEQITMGMLNQSVKEAMTGGSVAVVGAGGVNTTNLVDKAVTPIKLSTSGYQVMLAGPVVAKYDSIANTLEIPNEIMVMQQSGSTNGIGKAVTPTTLTGLPNEGWLVYDASDKLIKVNNNPTSTQSKCGYVWRSHVDGPKCVLFGIDVYVDGFKQSVKYTDVRKTASIKIWTVDGYFRVDVANKRLYMPDEININNGFEMIQLKKSSGTLDDFWQFTTDVGYILFDYKLNKIVDGGTASTNQSIFGYYDFYNLKFSIPDAKNQLVIDNGKKVSFLGDSITEGVNTTYTYHQYIHDELKRNGDYVECINVGIGGTTVAIQSGRSDSFIERKDTVAEDCDVIVIFGGTNDYGASNALGAIDDGQENTFLGAYSLLIDWYHVNRPNAKIICCTPLRRYYKGSTQTWKDAHTVKNGAGLTLQDYAEAVRDVAREKAVPVVDLYFESGLDFRLENIRTQYGADGLHPNAEGHKYFYPMILQKINQVFSK